MKIKHSVHLAITLVLLILISALLGVILLRGAYKLPVWAMEANVESSAHLLINEGIYPEALSWCFSRMDNWTDSLMLSIAGNQTTDRSLIQAMLIPVPTTGNVDSPFTDISMHYVEGKPYVECWPYSHYWHGYLVFLKPLMLFMDLSEIRLLNAIVQTVMLCIIIQLMCKRKLRHLIIPYLISILFLVPTATARSLQYSSCYYMMTLGVLSLLACGDKYEKYAPYIFLMVGAGTSFLDLLTYPIITLGVPAVIYCCRKGYMPIKTALAEGFQLCFCWGMGYLGMWASKWALGTFFLDSNIFDSAFKTIKFRTSMGEAQADSMLNNIQTALTYNVESFFYTPVTYLAAAAIAVYLVLALFRKADASQEPVSLVALLFPYAVLVLVPLAWYIMASNYSMIHFSYTSKSMMISVFSVLAASASLWQTKQPKKL